MIDLELKSLGIGFGAGFGILLLLVLFIGLIKKIRNRGKKDKKEDDSGFTPAPFPFSSGMVIPDIDYDAPPIDEPREEVIEELPHSELSIKRTGFAVIGDEAVKIEEADKYLDRRVFLEKTTKKLPVKKTVVKKVERPKKDTKTAKSR